MNTPSHPADPEAKPDWKPHNSFPAAKPDATSSIQPCEWCGSVYIHSDWCESLRRETSTPTPATGTDTPETDAYFETEWVPGMPSRKEFCQSLEAARNALRAQLDAAKKAGEDDKARLDWIANHDDFAGLDTSAFKIKLYCFGRDFRAAIDAARSASTEEKP